MLKPIFVAALLLVGASLAVTAQDKAMLTDVLREALATGGADAARERFDEIWPAQKAEYEADPTAMMTLMQELSQTGDMEAMSVIAEINSTVMQDMISVQLLEGMADYQDPTMMLEQGVSEQEARDAEIEQEAANTVADQRRGAVRDDLHRFAGLYAKAGDPPARSVFVSETCDGYLAASPLWADIAPWRMRSATDAVFTYADTFTTFALEFELDGDGKATSFSHDIEGMESPLVRIGDLPEEYSDCLPEPTR